MKKVILFSAVVLMCLSGLAQAQEQQASKELGVTIDLTYVSRYIWRGFDVYSRNHSGIQPSATIDLWGSGFAVKAWASMSNGGGAYENSKEMDYTVSYSNSFFNNEAYQMNYTAGWVYYNYPDGPARNAAGVNQDQDCQEVFAAFAFPNICSFGVVPSYTLVHMWPDEGGRDSAGNDNSTFRQCAGWAHIFGLDYGLAVPSFLGKNEDQILNLHAEFVYNDGVGPGGAAVDHDWSHAVFGMSTDFPITDNLTFTPGINYQSSWDDSVNTSDEYWTSLCMSYTF